MKGYKKIMFIEMIEMGKIFFFEDVNDVRLVSFLVFNFCVENGF